MDEIITYQVKKGDSLDSIAQKIGLSKDELKRFHNTYCDLKNLLGNELKEVSQILLPSENFIKEIQEQSARKPISKIKTTLHFHPHYFFSNYEVNEVFTDADQKKIRINYQTQIEKGNLSDENFEFLIKAFNYKKDKKILTDKISNLSIKCFESISPIPLILSKSGELIGTNQKRILQKFKTARPDLEDFFTGAIEKKYLDKFEQSLQNENYVWNRINSDLLYQTLFTQVSKFQTEETWQKKTYLKTGGFPVSCNYKVESVQEDETDVEFSLKGESTESCSLWEFLKGKRISGQKPGISAVLEFKYKIDKRSRKLSEAKGKITILNNLNFYNEHLIELKTKA